MYLTSFPLYSKGRICERSVMRGSDMRGSTVAPSLPTMIFLGDRYLSMLWLIAAASFLLRSFCSRCPMATPWKMETQISLMDGLAYACHVLYQTRPLTALPGPSPLGADGSSEPPNPRIPQPTGLCNTFGSSSPRPSRMYP